MIVHRHLRRPLILLGILFALFAGAASIRAAAAWTAASAPLADKPPSVESLRADLEAEQARSQILQAQLDQLNADSADLVSALAVARDRIDVDATQATALQHSLAAAKAKLAALEKSIAKARAAAAASARSSGPTVTLTSTSAPHEDGEHEDDDGG